MVYSIVIDKNKDIFLAGVTSSEDFPATNGAFDESYNGGRNDCFIVKIEGALARSTSNQSKDVK